MNENIYINCAISVSKKWITFQQCNLYVPNNFQDWQVLQHFYAGLNHVDHQYLDIVFHGEIFDMDPDEVLSYINYLAWKNFPPQNILEHPRANTFVEDTCNEYDEPPEGPLEVMRKIIEKMNDANAEFLEQLENKRERYSPDPIFDNSFENSSLHISAPLIEKQSYINHDFYCGSEENLECTDFDLKEFFPDIDNYLYDKCSDDLGNKELYSNFDSDSSVDSFDLECEEQNLRHIDTFIEETSQPKVIESTHILNIIEPFKPNISSVIHSNNYWEVKCGQDNLDHVCLKNAKDEFERLIFNPGISSSPQNINVELNQCNDNVTILYDLITSSHYDLDTFGDHTLMVDDKNSFDIVGDISCVCSDKFINDSYNGDEIDFIIPIFHPHMNSTLLLTHANHISSLYLTLGWRHVRQEKNRNWLGDYPYWEIFGSMEFMPTSSRVVSFLLRKEVSSNTWEVIQKGRQGELFFAHI